MMKMKIWDVVALILILIFVGFTILFYQERTLFLDNPYQIFRLLHDDYIIINAKRWPAAIVRVLPFMVFKLGGGLKAIMISFSLAYTLYHLLVFYLIRFVNKQSAVSICYLAYLIIPVAHSFYWCNSELILGLSLVFLLWSSIEKGKKIFSTILVLLIPWFHPLLILVVLFFVILSGLFDKGNWKWYGFLTVLSLGMDLIKKIGFPNWYDTMKQNAFAKELQTYSIDSCRIFELFSNVEYYPIALTFILSTLILVFRRAYTKTFLFIGFVFSYLLITDIGITEYHLHFYHEVSFLVVFVASIYAVYNHINWIQRSVAVIISTFCILGFFRIYDTSSIYNERINWIAGFSKENDKAIIKYDSDLHTPLVLPWAVSYESAIISTLNGETRTFLMVDNPENYTIDKSIIFLGHSLVYDESTVNRGYFNFSKGPYFVKSN